MNTNQHTRKNAWKRILSFLLCLFLCASLIPVTMPNEASAAGDVTINATNFPDANFRSYVSSTFDKDSNGKLSATEISNAKSINCPSKNISSLVGIEKFTELTDLTCNGNSISSLNLSNNTKLISLYCYNNALTALNLSKNTALQYMMCSGNQISKLDLSNNKSLRYMACDNNQLTTLNVSMLTALTDLSCYGNQLTSLDVSKNTKLEYLSASDNQLTSLDVSKNTALLSLACGYNQLTSLDVSALTKLEYLSAPDNRLTSLNVSKNTALDRLVCANNQLTSLDVSKNTKLAGLNCSDNQLTSLDVSKNTALLSLVCSYNQLTALDVSTLTKLEYLSASDNRLTTLNVSKNTALDMLGCANNQLTSLDVSKNTALVTLNCSYNQLTELNLCRLTALDRLTCFNIPTSKVYVHTDAPLSYVGKSDSVTIVRITPAKITKHPSNVTVADGATAKMSVTASGTSLSYQWQVRTKDSQTWYNVNANVYSGGQTATLTIPATQSRSGLQFRCKVTNAASTAYSNGATLTVTASTAPTITKHPSNVTVADGATAKMSVTASGTNLSYQWQVRTKDSQTWYNVNANVYSGGQTATLTIPATLSRSGLRFRCKVTNAAGTAYSNGATLTVFGKPTITKQPASVTVADGTTTTMSVTATGTNLSYQWQVRTKNSQTWYNVNANVYSGGQTATLTIPATLSRSGLQFRCKVTNAAGTVYSNGATLTVFGKPTITKHPSNVTTTDGATVKMSVTASGTNLSYQWQVRTKDSQTWYNVNANVYSGGQTATLTIPAKLSRSGLQFRCKVTNAAGTVYSNAATLTVKP